ncbi:MAG: ribosomal protein S18-alanine N-acetyltransferase [Burkholderiales bacterium]
MPTSRGQSVGRSGFDSDGWRSVAGEIRAATEHDLAKILEIEHLAFPTPWSLKSFKHELSLPFSRLTVAASRGLYAHHIVGFLCRWLIDDECHVLNVAVHPQYRRTGIGGRLLTDAIADAHGKGARFVTLEVRRSNLAARHLYRKFSFEERRLRRHYYGPGEDAIVMELQLA